MDKQNKQNNKNNQNKITKRWGQQTKQKQKTPGI